MGKPLVRLTDVAQARLVQEDFLQDECGHLCTNKGISAEQQQFQLNGERKKEEKND